ncbi:AAA-domain-containing protein [Coccomyxa subellipsoidea C-169]|uniref:AAA-domain-containing protein n=1 Tax=Coccomyxa subellipsoidea (strain C-169) TaxID=574566 RepID=I0YTA1_COCSC|nr:AAA-domain-containing protein [Coccomyxa subellipsoidea C-169]EIE21620.1 AAA-domain-containing protein [Coccomyxa subellipsoidea C-169]|eukprot:XP_005646164.1 AAA-domain-containing protein [Coccomyxa subellipsoidea C-169]
MKTIASRCSRLLHGKLSLMKAPDASVCAVTTSAVERLRIGYEDRGKWAFPLLGFAGLALGCSAAACEADPDALAAKDRLSILQAWEAVDQDLHRDEAVLPLRHIASRPTPPTVRCSPGQLVVRFPVRQGVDLYSVMNEIASAFTSKCTPGEEGNSHVVSKITEDDAWHVFHFECDAPGGPAHGLQARVLAPKRRHGSAEVEFQTQGSLTDTELDIITAAMRAANAFVNKVEQGYNTVDVWGSEMNEVREGVAGLFRELERSFSFGIGMLPGIERHMAREMQRIFDTGETGEALPAPRQSIPIGPQEHSAAQAKTAGEDANKGYGSAEAAEAADRLLQLGVTEPDGYLIFFRTGYEDEKRTIEDTVLLALLHPEVYDEVAKGTRQREAGSTRPRAVLFQGPPGCGKTTSAKVIASQAAVPLVYVPLEAVASKWYGESERNLSEIFKAAEDLGGAIIFLDEIDSLATQRSSEMHEATRRLLGVLLRQMDGFGPQSKSVIIGATNRRQDLDPALLSRFDAAVDFGYPDQQQQILKQLARHLSDDELAELAELTGTGNISGRDLRDIAEQTERAWASKIVRGEIPKGQLPTVEDYKEFVARRMKEKKGPLMIKNIMPSFY